MSRDAAELRASARSASVPSRGSEKRVREAWQQPEKALDRVLANDRRFNASNAQTSMNHRFQLFLTGSERQF
jgi:hypothetical protein